MSDAATPRPLVDPALAAIGVEHGFGVRGSTAPEDCVFAKQVHGVAVARLDERGRPRPEEADALLCVEPGASVGIVTADCVPILVASEGGDVVAAIHAGWRGFAAGVIPAGLRAVRDRVGDANLVAAIGPAARGCCYEVDRPVREALAVRHAVWLDEVLVAGRPDRWQLDLPLLAERVLAQNEWKCTRIGTAHRLCTICGDERFESYRRDGAAAGRLRHFINRSATIPRQG